MRNKQKLWRRSACPAKEQFVAQGLHVKGRRYGRIIKATLNGPKIKAVPQFLAVLHDRFHEQHGNVFEFYPYATNQQVLPA